MFTIHNRAPPRARGAREREGAGKSHAEPKIAESPLYVPYEMSRAPLAGVIQFSPLAVISRESTPLAVPAAMSGVVYPAE